MEKTCGDLPLLLLPLPEDVLISILLCLPVKSLLRFKSVRKSWLQLIQTPFFIDLHTTTSSSKFGGAFILQTNETSLEKNADDDIKLFMLSSSGGGGGGGGTVVEDNDNEDDDDDDDQKKKKKMVIKMDDLGFLPFYKDTQLSFTLRMVGSCNGIICLHDPMLMHPSKSGIHQQHYSDLKDVCLWNPATRQFRILPKSIPIQEKPYYMDCLEDFIAFGFDVKTKDYKVLRITPWDYGSEEEEEGGGCLCRVQVYSLSTDSWRLLEGINSLPYLPNQDLFLNSGIYLNGSYFFVGEKPYTQTYVFMLMSFDFTKEIFTTMQQLPPDNNNNNNTHVLSYLGEKLALFTFQIDCDDGYDYYDIWVLLNEQHGSSSSGQGVVKNNESSWTKLHSFRIKSTRVPSQSEPRCISNDGEFALISTIADYHGDGYWREKLQLFNLVTKEAIKDFTMAGGEGKCRADVYKESLVSIMGGGNMSS